MCSVRGLLCCLVSPSEPRERLSVLAAIPHQRSPPQTHENNLPIPLLGTGCPSRLFKPDEASRDGRQFFQSGSGEGSQGCSVRIPLRPLNTCLPDKLSSGVMYGAVLWRSWVIDACLSAALHFIIVGQGWDLQEEGAPEDEV